jgi:hypothetical protein
MASYSSVQNMVVGGSQSIETPSIQSTASLVRVDGKIVEKPQSILKQQQEGGHGFSYTMNFKS